MKIFAVAFGVVVGLVLQNVNASPFRNAEVAPDCGPLDSFFAPHENCSKYYLCDNGNLLEQNCPGNLYWNQNELLCDFQYNVPECVGGTRPPGGETGAPPTLPPAPTTAGPTEEPETEAPTDEPETEAPTEEPTEAPTEAPETEAPSTEEPEEPTTEGEPEPTDEPTTRDPNNPCEEDGVYTLPVPEDCQAYIQCFNGLAIEMSCAEGLQFDPEIGKCNKEELVNCTAVTTEPPATTLSPVCVEDGVYNVPFDGEYCSQFYILCAEHVPVLQECADGLLFDLDELTCKRAEDVECKDRPTTVAPTTPPPELECREAGVYNMPIPDSDCTAYILCVNYNAVPQTCADGTIFSEEELKCVREEDYVCPIYVSDSPTDLPPSTGVTDAPVTGGDGETGPTTDNLYPCPPEGFHYLPHHETCSKFYMCSDGQFRGVYTCGSSYWFHSEIQGCVPPEESDCTLEPLPTSAPRNHKL